VHPSDPVLLAWIHGELGSSATAEVMDHVRRCDDCGRRAREVREGDEVVDRLLRVLDHPVPALHPPASLAPRRRLRPSVLAASLGLLIAGAAAAAVPGSPVHRWIHDRLLSSPAPQPAPRVSPPVVPPPAQAAGGIEVPVAPRLTVVFGAEEPGGVLTVTVADRADVSLKAFGGQVAYQVGAGKIGVDNRRPAGRYALDLPASVRRLTVVLGGRTIYDSDGSTPGSTGHDTIPLSTDHAQ
jgi:anti-sigma factor RsiW